MYCYVPQESSGLTTEESTTSFGEVSSGEVKWDKAKKVPRVPRAFKWKDALITPQERIYVKEFLKWNAEWSNPLDGLDKHTIFDVPHMVLLLKVLGFSDSHHATTPCRINIDITCDFHANIHHNLTLGSNDGCDCDRYGPECMTARDPEKAFPQPLIITQVMVSAVLKKLMQMLYGELEELPNRDEAGKLRYMLTMIPYPAFFSMAYMWSLLQDLEGKNLKEVCELLLLDEGLDYLNPKPQAHVAEESDAGSIHSGISELSLDLFPMPEFPEPARGGRGVDLQPKVKVERYVYSTTSTEEEIRQRRREKQFKKMHKCQLAEEKSPHTRKEKKKPPPPKKKTAWTFANIFGT